MALPHCSIFVVALTDPQASWRSRWWDWTARWALIALACWLAGRLGHALAQVPGHAADLMPLAGVALAVMLRWGSACAPAVFVGALAAGWSAGTPLWLCAAVALGQTAGPWVASQWLLRSGFDPRLPQRRDVFLLISIGVLGGTMLSAANTAAWMAAAGLVHPVQLPGAWFRWWAADSVGLMIVGVPLLSWQLAPWRRAFNAANWPGSTGLLLLLAACVALAMAGTGAAASGARALWLAPLVLLCGLSLRNGAAVASSALLVLTLGVLLSSLNQAGELFGGPVSGANWVLAYLMACSALVLLPQAMVGELARLEERWQLAMEGSDLGVADWSLRTGQGYTSPRWRALLSDPDGLASDTLQRWLSMVHPDDRAPLNMALGSVISPARAGLRQEARIQTAAGWCWFDVHLIVSERDAAGQPQRVVATIADIGARRSAQDRQQLSSNLFMHLHEGLLITDADMVILDANPTFSRIMGVARDELLGTVPSLLRADGAPDFSGRVQHAAMWADLRTSGHWVGEIIDRRHNGDACALHVTVSAVNGPDGALRYHVLVVTDITEQRLQRERLERQANFDELTRLPNRAHLTTLLGEAMRHADADGHLLVVCYLDLDHFKAVNDRLGHPAGDRLLAELAIRLRGALRARGSARLDAAARLGGDEFALLMHTNSVDEARGAVERLLRVVAQPFMVAIGGEPVLVTASIGATLYPLDGSDADTLLRHADHAMYGAKQGGRNGCVFFDSEQRRQTEQRVVAIGRVQEALDERELMLYYQPKVDLRRGVVLGFEALLRWNHPEQGVLAPAKFLPLIEHTGLSARIGDHVLAQALDQLDAWQAKGLDLSVSVNISARHLQESDFVQRLAELLARHTRALGPRLELEVLETAALTDIGFTSALLERCARLGVRWALDDFGTGYSTLTYLKRLPVQVLKIDRSFVQNMLTDAQDRAIVEGVISLARTFDCLAVAEGVETPAQARMLLDLGCDVGQGEGIAAPMPADQVVAWVANWRGLFALSSAPLAANGMRPPTAE